MAAENIGRSIFNRICHGCFRSFSPTHYPLARPIDLPDFHSGQKKTPAAVFWILEPTEMVAPFSVAQVGC